MHNNPVRPNVPTDQSRCEHIRITCSCIENASNHTVDPELLKLRPTLNIRSYVYRKRRERSVHGFLLHVCMHGATRSLTGVRVGENSETIPSLQHVFSQVLWNWSPSRFLPLVSCLGGHGDPRGEYPLTAQRIMGRVLRKTLQNAFHYQILFPNPTRLLDTLLPRVVLSKGTVCFRPISLKLLHLYRKSSTNQLLSVATELDSRGTKFLDSLTTSTMIWHRIFISAKLWTPVFCVGDRSVYKK